VKRLGDLKSEHNNLSLHTSITEKIQRRVQEKEFSEQLDVEQALFVQNDTVGIGVMCREEKSRDGACGDFAGDFGCTFF
jgi:hypothetical protein